jgi:CheY-like chemotaxis protein
VLLVSDAVESTMKLLAPTIGENVAIRIDLDTPLWSVYADPGTLNQVVMNLALNARDAMPGGGRLTIEARNLRADETYTRQHPSVRSGDYVQLIVSDDGIGIPPDIREHIFDPFFSTKSTGTGLGLAVVRGIIEQTGGHIWVYSEVGEGTTFKILLPRHAGVAERSRDLPEPLPLRGHDTVLLVEDEQLLRAVVKDTLEEHGYRVLEAAAAAEALRISRAFPGTIALLLTDVIMPEVTGPALAEILLKERPQLRVIFSSGYTDDVIVHHGVLQPGVRFLEKPATTNTLLRAVSEALA